MPTRWNSMMMQARGQRLFKTMYRKKRLSQANHDIHFLARSVDKWLPKAVQSLVNGTYCPQDLKRHYFEDDTVDSLHLTDRIAQNILLHEIKSTFSSVMSNHCYHLHGPHGVKLATDKVRFMLQSGFSALKTQTYLRQWTSWWVRTVEGWSYDQLLSLFIDACYEHNLNVASVADGLRCRHAQKIAMQSAKLIATLL